LFYPFKTKTSYSDSKTRTKPVLDPSQYEIKLYCGNGCGLYIARLTALKPATTDQLFVSPATPHPANTSRIEPYFAHFPDTL